MPLIQLGAGGMAPVVAAWLAARSGYSRLEFVAGTITLVGYCLMATAALVYARWPRSI